MFMLSVLRKDLESFFKAVLYANVKLCFEVLNVTVTIINYFSIVVKYS